MTEREEKGLAWLRVQLFTAAQTLKAEALADLKQLVRDVAAVLDIDDVPRCQKPTGLDSGYAMQERGVPSGTRAGEIYAALAEHLERDTFKLGDVVRLKIGGPAMTVEHIGPKGVDTRSPALTERNHPHDGLVWCVWFAPLNDEKTLWTGPSRGTFAPESLERCEASS